MNFIGLLYFCVLLCLVGCGKFFNFFDMVFFCKVGNLEFVLIIFLNGLGYGFLLFLLFLGLMFIYSMMGVFNFVYVSFYMLGVYVVYVLVGVFGFWWVLLLVFLIVGVVGVLVEYYGLCIVYCYGYVLELLFIFGLFYLVVELV